MSEFISISDKFQALVNDTQAAIIADTTLVWGTLPKRLYFMHGNVKEVMGRLQLMTNSPSKKNEKYPLVVLFRDIVEDLSQGLTGYSTKFKAKVGIFTLTEQGFNSVQREAKNFKPILLPILRHLITQITQSATFGQPIIEQLKPTKVDCFFYGTQVADKNILNDFIDAIEVDLHLEIKNNYC